MISLIGSRGDDDERSSAIAIDTPAGESDSVSDGSIQIGTVTGDDQGTAEDGESDSMSLAFELGGLISSGIMNTSLGDDFDDHDSDNATLGGSEYLVDDGETELDDGAEAGLDGANDSLSDTQGQKGGHSS
jgi:hypothetical protein